MPAGELADPVSYSGAWTAVMIVLPLLVVVWYATVTWLTRDRSISRVPAWYRLWRLRRLHLRELDRIERAQARGELSTRQAHQAVSATVRSFVSEVGPVDTRVMNLEQLREGAEPRVVALVELVYPPAFEPGGQAPAAADERLGTALTDARELVSDWS